MFQGVELDIGAAVHTRIDNRGGHYLSNTTQFTIVILVRARHGVLAQKGIHRLLNIAFCSIGIQNTAHINGRHVTLR